MKKYCPDCGNTMYRTSKHCIDCFDEHYNRNPLTEKAKKHLSKLFKGTHVEGRGWPLRKKRGPMSEEQKKKISISRKQGTRGTK